LEIKVIVGDIAQIEADAIVVNLFEGVEQPGGATAAVDKALDGAISSLSVEVRLRVSLGKLALSIRLGNCQQDSSYCRVGQAPGFQCG